MAAEHVWCSTVRVPISQVLKNEHVSKYKYGTVTYYPGSSIRSRSHGTEVSTSEIAEYVSATRILIS